MKLRVVERREPSSSSDLEQDLATTSEVAVRDDLARARAEMVERSHKAWIEKISRSRKGAEAND